jgi:putative CocE/NonD family hydrolase
VASVAALALLPAQSFARTSWQPEPARYGIQTTKNVGIKMRDGTVLRANVLVPADPKTGKPAAGPFPVIMVQTPYGKDSVGSASGSEGGAEAATQAGPLPYFVKRGYIDVVAEVRGTGNSHGTFDLLNPIEGRDGAELVRWAAGLPHSNGKVGLYGPSYMGLDQYMTAAALPPGSPLKAMFPIVAGNDTYRDVVTMGGIPDGEFDLAVVATIFGPLELINPPAETTDLADLLQVELEHAPALASYNLSQIINILSGGDESYDQHYWQQRAPRTMLGEVVRNHIPVFAIDGWDDLYQRGAMLNYSGLQNLDAGRPVGAPMLPNQQASGRYQLMQGSWYHLTAGTGIDVYPIELAWFDRWLKGEDTGIDHTSTPLHSYEMGGKWVDSATYPYSEAHPTTLHLGAGPSATGAPSLNDGTLTQRPPDRAAAGADRIAFTPATSPCARPLEQWSMGAGELAFESGGLPPDPCRQDDRSIQAGPGALTYTTKPLQRATLVAGPIDASIYASSTTPDTAFVANVEDVAPDGSSKPLTEGALLGSFRKLDRSQTWYGQDGQPLAPYHPYTQASVRPVPTGGKVRRFDIELFPIVARLAKGHSLRLTITTSDTPHLLFTPVQTQHLAGGEYEVQRRPGAGSFLEVPLARPDAFGPCGICR